MTEEIAYKAIDHYFKIYTSGLKKVPIKDKTKYFQVAVPNIGWYGGEPFLNFELIKKTKKYFEALPWNCHGITKEQLTYSVVSNLTILTEEIIEFLLNTNIFLFVSLDGGRAEHNANRVDIKGNGSFKNVMKNINYLIKVYPEFAKKRMMIQSVLADNTSHKNVQKFIQKTFYSNGLCKVLKTTLYPQKNIKEFVSRVFLNTINYGNIEVFHKNIRKLNEHNEEEIKKLINNDPRLLSEFDDLFSLESVLSFDNPTGKNSFSRSFSCPLGIDIFFVSAKGDIHMCNKTDQSMPLGNVTKGISIKAMKKLYSSYYIGLENKCNKCWAFQFCKICPANLLFDSKFYLPEDIDCNYIRKTLERRFEKYIVLSMYDQVYAVIESLLIDKKTDFLTSKGSVHINQFGNEPS